MAYSFESRITKESKACPGVRFTLNKMTDGRRSKLRLETAEAAANLREAMAELRRRLDEEERDVAAITKLRARVSQIIEDEITPAWVRWGVHRIEGLEIDGERCETADRLIEDGPLELFAEIAVEIQKEAGLTEEEKGESEPPTTSGGLVDGGTNGTTAKSVSDSDITVAGTAGSDSPEK